MPKIPRIPNKLRRDPRTGKKVEGISREENMKRILSEENDPKEDEK